MITWSAKQRRVEAAINDPAASVILAAGPVQSGKTMSAIYFFLAWVAQNWSGHDFALAARSQKQFEAVLGKYARAFGAQTALGWTRRESHYDMASLFGAAPNHFYVALGSDVASEQKIRGWSLGGALLDEVTLMPPSFVDTILDRCSMPGAIAVMCCNPAGPKHSVKAKFIDTADAATHIGFELSDNPTLTEAYINGLLRRYTGAMRERMVFGRWAASMGLIYPNVEKAVGDAPPLSEAWRVDLTADHADAAVTHALLMASYPGEPETRGHPARPGARWVIREWRYDGRERGQLTETEQAVRIRRDLVAGASLGRVLADPAALGFRRALSKALGVPAIAANNEVLPGLQKTRELMDDGLLKIDRSCRALITEMHNYHWDERAGLTGADRPVKEDDHGCDALRYDAWYGTAPYRRVKVLRHNATR